MKYVYALLLASCLIFTACGTTTSARAEESPEFSDDVKDAIARFKSHTEATGSYFKNAHAYAVFPNVGKGAVGLGGAHGSGQVFKDGKHVANSDLTQLTFGLALGGQEFSEIVFFKDEAAFKSFKRGSLKFSAQASAVAVEAGASADASYEYGVRVFTMTKGGTMFDASIGGQSFDYVPVR